MRKLFAILLTLCMLFSFVSFASAEENVTITFAFWDNNQEPGMKAIADAYMAAHPGVTVEVQVTPWDQYWTKLEASAQGSGEAMPDVFWMHSNQFFKYVTADKLLPLDFEYDYTPYPAGVTALYNFNNVHYAVPKDYDTIALVYNKEIFDNAGIAYPDDTWTWDTLLETAKKLTDPEKGIYGFGAPNDRQSGYLNLIYQNEGFAFEDGKSGYDQAATQEAIQWWVDLQKVHQVSPSQESFVDMGVDDQMQAGKLAMCFTGSWMMSSYTNNELFADKFDLAVLPQGKTRASIYNGLGYAGAASTKYPEVVKDFIQFCGTEEANKLQAEKKAAIPAFAGTEKYFTDNFTTINIACYPEMISYGVQYPFSPNKSLWESQEEELMNEVYAGSKTVEEACNELHEIICDIEGI
ncbi:ABC transporter substrate-binding protein [Aristaeella hokkaidonensis]|uniref:Sugar ABC transporter substrate-binding protein n=1 Tax=Aristaeella hokkaidonensis TaxID=3046382 RepID=A0AC61MUZ0_9FIRM|nr:sugar ABC transporter substrate-binding protein [Aristaeella hokkaidonensis]QUC65942.1 sugar ABC transporter substrate-binding protein [Aristaeella hokkaidonensis]SNT93839.1 carbohydrate ABC transporter substrate-binding protein, CUT1 family [Aristaeella hokkaidonensis]